MRLTSPSFQDNGFIPDEYALCAPAGDARTTLAPNRNPTLVWDDLPAGTRSLVIICHDPDAPTQADRINKEGHLILEDAPRGTFYHWVLVDISPTLGAIHTGEFSEGLSRYNKRDPEGRHSTRQGLNHYTEWFANDPEMRDNYFGYDGPCPPWNDAIPHRYIFTLYALDVERCPVEGNFRAVDVFAAIEGHVLATASLTGIYSMNPELRRP